jgi:hypothetical protein
MQFLAMQNGQVLTEITAENLADAVTLAYKDLFASYAGVDYQQPNNISAIISAGAGYTVVVIEKGHVEWLQKRVS